MAQIFGSTANTVAKVSIVAGAMLFGGGLILINAIDRSAYTSGVNIPPEQPVPFSHKHHVSGVGIDCRYCHTSVEKSATSGIPATEICMSCHTQIWADAPMLEPVRESYRTGKSIEWVKVHDLPAYAYFHHAIHVNKGFSCATCHGRVDQMPLIWKVNTLHMNWCLDCHRNPEKYIRPKEEVYNMAYQPKEDQLVLGARLVKEYNVRKLTDCSVCHR